mmetsp:Transcript_15153/g.28734  ORF Transcript_15153/g.28734 Transcript_15153/m.28734 type:complete len:310 (-) Transcript_15153:41-970(-)|eukprot:scaffold4770_cov177-Amphora_coffeaeformis.AAC.4
MTTMTKVMTITALVAASSVEAFSTHYVKSTTTTTTTTNGASTTVLNMGLSKTEVAHATEVFHRFGREQLEPSELADMLNALDIGASDDEAGALFKFLDTDGNGTIGLDEFLPWYEQAATVAKEQAEQFQSLLLSRRTVDEFLTTDIDDEVLKRAIQCAIAAPNRRGSEPWQFIKLGKETVQKVAALKAKMKGVEDIDTTVQRWTQIPGWCVVTYPRSPEGNNWQQREDFKSVCCAIENFMLSMWAEGIGSKWTDGEIQRTREFAELIGINYDTHKVGGVIWYGFATQGLGAADSKKRRKGVDDVLEVRP